MPKGIQLKFPFSLSTSGSIFAYGGDEAIRGKIIQILFTAPGERVNLPEFGCGLFNLLFEPNDTMLATRMEFAVAQALNRWMVDEIAVQYVHVESYDEKVTAEIAYTRKLDLVQDAVRIHFR